MSNPLREQFDALLATGQAERLAERAFVGIFALPSGSRFGLVDDLAWAVVEGDTLSVFQEGSENVFVEVLEYPRSDVDERLEKGAAERGLDVDQVLFSFPAVELVRALLGSRSQHFCRLGLMWLLPSELRLLKREIAAVAADTRVPALLRGLAERLMVAD